MKRMWVAMLLGFFLGIFGAHRMYLGEKMTALWYIGVWSMVLIWTSGGSIFAQMVWLGVWLETLIFVPARVRAYNMQITGASAQPSPYS